MENNNPIALVAILSLLLASCNNDSGLENRELSGKEVSVRIRSLSVAEGNSENLTRSALQKEPEMVSQPIGDGILLEMSIKEDESPLRATVELSPNARFRVIAVEKNSTNYYSHGDYIYGSGTLTPSNDFHVKVGDSYDYICLSYNSTATLPSVSYTAGQPLPTSFTIDTTKDFLWCRIAGSAVPSTGVDLNIILKQKLSKVTITLDCSYNNWNIRALAGKVSIAAINATTMNWTTGVLTGTDVSPLFSFQSRSSPDSPTHTSNELTILPTTSNAVITLADGSVTRTSPLIALPVTTSSHTLSRALTPGVNYTIHIQLRTPIFARSNIYWTGSAMDFVRAGSSDTSKDGYQGLFFRWGSLVGISPVVTNWGSGIPCYWPNNSSLHYYSSWGEIPYENDVDVTEVGAPNTTTRKGDICTQIDPLYRLPKVGEFGSVGGNWNTHSWTKGTTFSTFDVSATYTDGTYNFIDNNNGWANNAVLGIRIPASGARQSSNGALRIWGDNITGINGICWANTAANGTIGYCLSFVNTYVYVIGTGERGCGFSVRCVLK
jgi:hypothetical protein